MTEEQVRVMITAQNEEYVRRFEQAEELTVGLRERISELTTEMARNQQRINACAADISEYQRALRRLRTETNNGENATEEQREEIERLERAIEDGTASLGEFRAREMELRDSISSVNNELNRQRTEIMNAGNEAANGGSFLDGIFGKATAIASGALLGKIIGDGITEGMNSVESESLFETSLGAYADSAREWSDKVSGELGLDSYALRKNTGTLYTMTKNMGVAKNEALDMSETLSLLAEDMASYYNGSSEEMFAKLRSGLTGEAEPLKALGILVDENTVKQYAYKEGIAQVGEELTQSQKVMARYAAIMAQTSTAQGDLARTLGSSANQLRTLQNEAGNLLRDFGTTLLPTASAVFSIAREGLGIIGPPLVAVGETINGITDGLLHMSQNTRTLVTVALTATAAFFLLANSQTILAKAQAALTAVKTAYHAVLSVLIPKQWTFAAALKATAGWIGIIAAGFAIFSLINDINSRALETADDSADAFENEKDGADAAADGVDNLADSVEELGKSADRGLASVDKLNILGGNTGGSLTAGLVSSSDLDALAEAAELTSGLNAEMDELKNGMSGGLFDGLDLGPLEDIFNFGTDVWTWLFGDGAEQRAAAERVQHTLEDVNDYFIGFFGPAGEDWSEFWQGVGSGIYDISEGDVYGGLYKISKQFEDFFGDSGKAWNDFWMEVGSGIYQFANAWSDTLMNIGSGLYEFFNQDKIDKNKLDSKYTTMDMDFYNAMKTGVLEGLNAEEALSAAKAELLNTAEKVYYFETFFSKEFDLQAKAAELYESFHEDYSYPSVPNYSSISSSAYAGATRPDFTEQWGNSAEQKQEQVFNFTIQVDSILDGDKVGESVTTRQERAQTLSNGY